jgi:hypothetical protein
MWATAILDVDLWFAGGECVAERHLLGVLGDVDEPTAADRATTELADIDVAFAVSMRETEKGQFDAAAVIEVELERTDEQLCRLALG